MEKDFIEDMERVAHSINLNMEMLGDGHFKWKRTEEPDFW